VKGCVYMVVFVCTQYLKWEEGGGSSVYFVIHIAFNNFHNFHVWNVCVTERAKRSGCFKIFEAYNCRGSTCDIIVVGIRTAEIWDGVIVGGMYWGGVCVSVIIVGVWHSRVNLTFSDVENRIMVSY